MTVTNPRAAAQLQIWRPILLVIALVAVSWPVIQVAEHVSSSKALPQWDMAKYGLAGLALADAGRRCDVFEFVARTSAMSSWPPGFPLLEAPAFLLFGADYSVPRLLVCALFLMALIVAPWAGHQLDGKDGLSAGLLLAGLLAGSPLYQAFAGLVLLEIPGTLLLLLAAGSYFRALSLDTEASWRWTAIFSTALFFVKYNYGLMWLAPLVVSEVWRKVELWQVGLWQGLAGLGQRTIASAQRRKAWATFLGIYVLVLGWIRYGGGIDFMFLGIHLKANSLGNPVYILYLLLTLSCLAQPRRSREIWRTWWINLEPSQRILTRWLVMPIALWMLVPPHTKDFFGFVENRSSGLPAMSLENILFYPRVLVREYAHWPALGAVFLVAGVLPCLFLKRLEVRRRALALAVLGHGVAIWLHPYKLPRFAFTLVPLLWLLACWLLVRSLRELVERSPARQISTGLVMICATCAVLGIGSNFQRLEVEQQWDFRTVPPAVTPLLDRIAALAVEEEDETLVLGTWNLLAPSLLEWHFRRLYPQHLGTMPKTVWPSSKARRRVSSDLSKFERVMIVEPQSAMPQALASLARQENSWSKPLRAVLESGDTHILAVDEAFEHSGYRLRLFKRRM
jgi:hypothetical protein